MNKDRIMDSELCSDRTIEGQQKLIQALELRLLKQQEATALMKQKHFDINNQLVQANVTFQQAISESNRTIRALLREKDDLHNQIARERAAMATVSISNSVLKVCLQYTFHVTDNFRN